MLLLDESNISQLECVEQYVNGTGCAATDLACLCANEVFLSETKSCAHANCTVREGLSEYGIANPNAR